MSGPLDLHSEKIRGYQWKTLPLHTSRVMHGVTHQENKHMLPTKEKNMASDLWDWRKHDSKVMDHPIIATDSWIVQRTQNPHTPKPVCCLHEERPETWWGLASQQLLSFVLPTTAHGPPTLGTHVLVLLSMWMWQCEWMKPVRGEMWAGGIKLLQYFVNTYGLFS